MVGAELRCSSGVAIWRNGRAPTFSATGIPPCPNVHEAVLVSSYVRGYQWLESHLKGWVPLAASGSKAHEVGPLRLVPSPAAASDLDFATPR